MRQDLVDTLARLQQALSHDYRIIPVEAPDLPVFLAISAPLRPGVTGQKPRLPSGRGMTQLQALVASAAEAVELRSSLAQSQTKVIATLPRHNGVVMVPSQDLLTGATVLVPAQQVYLDFAATTAEPPSFDARSTGCAAAATRAQAQTTALLECIERDALAFWWHGGLAPAALSIDLIDAQQPRLAWWLERRGRRFQLLGLASHTGVPVVLAVSSDPEGGHVVTGSAARLDVASAALSAVTEMIQTEFSFARALKAGHTDATAWSSYASTLTQAPFDPPDTGPHPTWLALSPDGLLHRLAELGLRALSVDLTLAQDPLPSVRVLVPGLCDMAGRIDHPRFRQVCGTRGPHLPEPF